MTRSFGMFRVGLWSTMICMGLLSGCATPRLRLTGHPDQAAGAAVGEHREANRGAATGDAGRGGGEQGALLSAVEEFLRRTEDYTWPPTDEQTHADRTKTANRQRTSSGASPTNARDGGTAKPVGRRTAQASGPVHSSGLVNAAPLPGSSSSARPVLPAAVANTRVTLTDSDIGLRTPALPVLGSVGVRSAVPLVAEPTEPAESSTSNHPLDVDPARAIRPEDALVRELEARAEQTADFDSLWTLSLVQAALNRISELPASAMVLSDPAKQILGSVIRLIASARTAARDPLQVGDGALRRAEELRQTLADRADPEIPIVALCRKVVTYGVYEEMPEEDFIAGRPTQTIVYSEIRNLRSEKTPDGQFRTLLATRLEMLTPDGRSVWQQEEPDIEDVCRRRRTDFFVAQRITLPATLSEGDYILKVFAEDKLSGKANEASHPLTLHSPI
ncbi:MAG: hypothetical protein ACE5HE_10840 [Phycisphaerae bacterium]